MDAPKISVAEMEAKYVAREKDISGSEMAFIDQRIPGHEREICNVIGMNVTENRDDPALVPALGSAHGFLLVYNRAREGSGSGAALHTHQTEEVFIPMRGTWEVFWLEGEDERVVELGPLDVIHVPVGVYRGFRLISGEADALMMAIVGGPEAGNVGWHPSVIEQARATGLAIDDKGKLQEIG